MNIPMFLLLYSLQAIKAKRFPEGGTSMENSAPSAGSEHIRTPDIGHVVKVMSASRTFCCSIQVSDDVEFAKPP